MIALSMIAQATAGAVAQIVTLPFAPPLDRPVIEDNVVIRELADGKPGRFVVVREYRFERDGDGYLVVMRATGIDSDVTGPARTGFEVGSRPMINLPLRIRLDAQGRVVGVENTEEYWAAFTEGQMALRADLEGRPALTPIDRRIIAAVVDGLLAVPADQRAARLASDVGELAALGGRTVSTEVPIAFEAAGNRAGGSMVVTGIDEAAVTLELTASSGATPLEAQVDTEERIVVDRSSGLVVSRSRRRTTTQGDSVIATTESRTLR
ncbi:hypothetical protein GGR88_001425 [Sphingomonas jejuensis]|uniref:DUF4908 domain-containing protein n=1 Tax=Sphingomonas jejuensis TaxID=904715 RepID=A0ABX0XMN6_9SPHN|nr:hypothetical protein [Sphingomonas jejuensis]NJC33951.1 hypothetical protein [Sphingomonas jejuensis]